MTGKDGSALLPDPKRLRMAELLEMLVTSADDAELESAETIEGAFEVVEP